MNHKKLLKWLLIIGGIVEIVIGAFFLFVHFFLLEVGIVMIPLFNQMAGTFLIGFGILLIFASQNLEMYRVIPLVNILLRIIMITCSIIQLPAYPEFLVIFLPAVIYDLLWLIIVLILMKNLKLLAIKKE
jgi:hypothetical protein